MGSSDAGANENKTLLDFSRHVPLEPNFLAPFFWCIGRQQRERSTRGNVVPGTEEMVYTQRESSALVFQPCLQSLHRPEGYMEHVGNDTWLRRGEDSVLWFIIS